MNVRRYDSNIHEFYSDDCHANVFIRTAQGQTLTINSPVINSKIVYVKVLEDLPVSIANVISNVVLGLVS